MRQLSTPCLFSDHQHCTGTVCDLYGDEQVCACPCHHWRLQAAFRGGDTPSISSYWTRRPRQVPKVPPAVGPKREPEREPEPPILGLPSPVRLLLMLALAALLYLVLCTITTGVVNAAASLLSR